MEKTSDWVDVHNDALMVNLGIRPYPLSPRDPSVWTKTSKEKALLRKKRKTQKNNFISGWESKIKHPYLVETKLIVQIRPNNKFTTWNRRLKRCENKTTHTFRCFETDIPGILNMFNNSNAKVIKYIWNGKTYFCN